MTTPMPDIQSLIERVEAGERSNALDVTIEIALFRPDRFYRAVRPNAARTKLIYTSVNGHDSTHRAMDWTLEPKRTLSALRSRAQQGEG
jgi:hypothetical protein